MDDNRTDHLLKSLGFPTLQVHHPFNHFDFTRPSRRILVIGPMGSGKTEYSARVWRDSEVVKKKTGIENKTSTGIADRRNVFFVRSKLDSGRFPDYPDDALAYRGGYERCGGNIAHVGNSFELESVIQEHPEVGTWIIDEAAFYDERIVYIIRNESLNNGKVFIFPSLVLNFRKDIFNSTARFLLENATDVFPLTAYCEHSECIEDSFYTYRYYRIDEQECPAIYFDPLIVIGGDREKDSPVEPNYCTRCDEHHYLPGKEYTFLILKPLGEKAAAGDIDPLMNELDAIKNSIKSSMLYDHFVKKYSETNINMNTLLIPRIAEKALMFLFSEQNLLTEELVRKIVDYLNLDRKYLQKSLSDNNRPVDFKQFSLNF